MAHRIAFITPASGGFNEWQRTADNGDFADEQEWRACVRDSHDVAIALVDLDVDGVDGVDRETIEAEYGVELDQLDVRGRVHREPSIIVLCLDRENGETRVTYECLDAVEAPIAAEPSSL